MLAAGGALVSDLGDAIGRDPEVRQARLIAEAARTRLLACVSDPESGIDLAEARGMLDALGNARVLAADAEDRVLLHRGLLTPAEAERRATARLPVARGGTAGDPQAGPAAGLAVPRRPAALTAAGALALALLAAVAVLAGQRGFRLSRRGLGWPRAGWPRTGRAAACGVRRRQARR